MENKYSKLMKILHWLSAILVLTLILSGLVMVDAAPNDFKWLLYANHKSIGIIVFILFFVRIIVRLVSIVPKLPNELSSFWRISALTGHFVLYSLMLAVPFCGIAMSLFGGYQLSFFGIPLEFIKLVKNVDLATLFNLLHVYLAWGFAAIIALHILGALKHLLLDKLNLFKRII